MSTGEYGVEVADRSGKTLINVTGIDAEEAELVMWDLEKEYKWPDYIVCMVCMEPDS